MTDMNATHLSIVVRNSDPKREIGGAATWVLYRSGQGATQLTVVQDSLCRPRIVAKDAA